MTLNRIRKVISIENIGLKDVYDIQVDKTHSFLANGIVAHNCMIAHGVSRFLKERLFEKSDPYTINICDTCGNIATSQIECRFCKKEFLVCVLLKLEACASLFFFFALEGGKVVFFFPPHFCRFVSVFANFSCIFHVFYAIL